MSSYREAVSTLHCALDNGADLHVNDCHKIRHYRARSTEERRRRIPNHDFFTSRGAYIRKLVLYSDVIHLFHWKSAIEHDGGV